ncbi:uncharacterized protein B0J16DRAFT_59648 [Fusarium flagelliforme]|uniref:Uncharacterized protein n=1 Tax=Fusarium flagelliforme TaxID=2675880 RepID=A0A395MJQ8_9HYPO|nr:uncharacterized protein B0J16DRAFT_59648 [Fusarium flagelliforme]KAH7192421.1 hypothetical protein B0J16DRAFT_59648 [Fusarium flagelliforme]RFN48168.1 hypothetical protein FIE12Z_7619 [Fusarium flagelliforme]
MESYAKQQPCLSLSSSAMDLDTDRRTPSPVPSLGHDTINTPIAEMPTPPAFASTFSLPITAAKNLTVGSAGSPDIKNDNDLLPPLLPQTDTCGIERPDVSVMGGTPDFLLLYCFNIERAVNFYSRCFGWKFYGDMNAQQSDDSYMRRWGSSHFDTQPMNFFNSTQSGGSRITGALIQIKSAGDDSAHLEHRRQMAMAFGATPSCHIRVADIEMAESLIEYHYGEVKQMRFGVRQCIMDIGEFVDPEGNLIGLVALHPENATTTMTMDE